MNKTIRVIPALLIISIIFVGFAFAGDGRQRVSSISSKYSDVSDIEAEIRFGRELAARILGNYSLLDDEKVNRYVNLVGKALALYAGRPELRYHFGVLDSDIKGEEGSGVGGLAGLIGGPTASVRGALEQALDDAVDILFNRGYKVKDEIEADRVGILVASVAGYDPSALREFLSSVKSFEKEDRTYKGEHPIFEVRMREIDETLKAHGLQDVKKAKAKDRFYENIKK